MRMAVHLHGSVGTLENPQDGPSAFTETLWCCESHIEQVERLMAAGAPADALVLPRAAADHARSFVRRRLPLSDLLKTYRLGHQYLARELSAHLCATIEDRDRLGEALTTQSAFLFQYVDRICDLVIDVFRDEEVRWSSSAAAVRAETVDAILGRRPVDQDVAEQRLGHPLGAVHVGLVLSTPTQDDGRLVRAAEEFGDAAGTGPPMVVPVSASTAWAWCPARPGTSPVVPDQAAVASRCPGVAVAAGRPRPGIDGFRVSHQEATVAARYAVASSDNRAFVSYADVELVSLLAEDAERAGRFVRETLGPLAVDDTRSEQLRGTVLAYLRAGRSRKGAAAAVHMHPNGVGLRIARAETLLRTYSQDWGIETEAALALVEILGTAVLVREDGLEAARTPTERAA